MVPSGFDHKVSHENTMLDDDDDEMMIGKKKLKHFPDLFVMIMGHNYTSDINFTIRIIKLYLS